MAQSIPNTRSTGLLLALILSVTFCASAQNVTNTNAWYPNSTVQAIAEDNDFIYLGGNFTTFSDGITTVDLPYLARIKKSDNAPDLTWDTETDGVVHTLMLDGTDLYVGGVFTTCGGATRNKLAKVSTATGLAEASFDPAPDATVQAIVLSGTSVIVGGTFRNIAGTALSALAKLSKSDGTIADSWDTNVNLFSAIQPGTNFGNVEVLAIDGNDLYVGGGFRELNDGGSITNRNSIAKVSAADGTVDGTWNPDPGLNKLIHAMVVSGSSLYISGNFSAIGGQTRRNLAKLSTTGTGAADPSWDAGVAPNNGFVFALALSGTHLYAGGGFTSIGGQTINRLARLPLSGAPATDMTWNPNPAGSVNSLGQPVTEIIVGGNFTGIAGELVERAARLTLVANTPPQLDPVGDKAVDEDTELTFTATATDTETPAGLTFSLDATSIGKGMAIDPVTGVFTWTPLDDDVGDNAVTITVADSFDSDSETITVSVTAVNDAPVLAAVGNKSVAEDMELTFTATASDEETPGALTFSLDATSLAAGMTIGSTDGVFSWTPIGLQGGDHDVTIIVSDGELEDSETIVITVNTFNDPPVLASIGNQSADEDAQLTFTVTASDEESSSLTFSLDATSLGKGMTVDATSGVFSWVPANTDVGIHTVTLTVSDGDASDEETFDINVAEVNDSPVLSAIGNKSATENTELSFTATATDEETTSLTFSLDANSLSKGMTIDASTGAFGWTPLTTDIGTHDVTISVSDGASADSETIVITVNAMNVAPVLAVNAGLSVTQGTAINITASQLQVTDANNSASEIVFTVTSVPTNGKLKKGATDMTVGGTFTQADIDAGQIGYDHDGFNGATDKFTFTVSDGAGGEITATDFNITIDIVTALEESFATNGIAMYPNPAEHSVTIRITNSYRGPVNVDLVDMVGRGADRRDEMKTQETLTLRFDLLNVARGVLIVRVRMGNLQQSYRIVKK